MATATALTIVKSDYELLKRYVQTRRYTNTLEGRNAERLGKELENSALISDEADMPADVIRLHSRVDIQVKETGQQLSIELVLPNQANVSKNHISLLSPLGIALVGYRQQQTIEWEMPAGKKTLYIERVSNK